MVVVTGVESSLKRAPLTDSFPAHDAAHAPIPGPIHQARPRPGFRNKTVRRPVLEP